MLVQRVSQLHKSKRTLSYVVMEEEATPVAEWSHQMVGCLGVIGSAPAGSLEPQLTSGPLGEGPPRHSLLLLKPVPVTDVAEDAHEAKDADESREHSTVRSVLTFFADVDEEDHLPDTPTHLPSLSSGGSFGGSVMSGFAALALLRHRRSSLCAGVSLIPTPPTGPKPSMLRHRSRGRSMLHPV
mmetsp:Transcript_127526/g.271905  ORF Transcript_127526/g.271905 Transcript_127526/m.271905 type:complete len:184 (+) Transcript_127526:53-604(+)